MNHPLFFLTHDGFENDAGLQIKKLEISYQIFGQSLGTNPVVLVNHALTGNSDVAGEVQGWWKQIIGAGKLIDTEKYTVLAFNIPGNGFDGQLFEDYQVFSARDVARIFLESLDQLNVSILYAVIGGSLGGGIAWEMAALRSDFIKYVIPVASDWKASDWMIAHNFVQSSILQNSRKPLYDARMMAMLFYRTPASLKAKFGRGQEEEQGDFSSASWLAHHGDKLANRFDLKAYQLMNHLLTSIDITRNRGDLKEVLRTINSTIVQVGVNSDLFFVPDENIQTQMVLDEEGIPNAYHEIQSPHGHDAFLIEYEQLTELLTPYF